MRRKEGFEKKGEKKRQKAHKKYANKTANRGWVPDHKDIKSVPWLWVDPYKKNGAFDGTD